MMKPYLISLAVGLLVGIIYGALHVRSPAPPVIALVGLLGILIGEQVPPLIKQALSPQTEGSAWIGHPWKPTRLGKLPRAQQPSEMPKEER